MKEAISKEEFNEILNKEGKVRGVAFTTAAEFIQEKEGKEGVKRMEKAITKLGYPLKYKEIKTMDFYPIGLQVINIMAMKELFGYSNKEIEEMGSFNAKASLLIRLFMRYFVSVDKAARVAAKMWRKHYTIGKLIPAEYDEKEGFLRLRLEDFPVHPLLCIDLKGYFASVVKMVIGKKVTVKETKCMHRGDEFHEFFLEW